MRKGTEIIGKSVIAFDTGEKFETVLDLIFDQNSNRILGFLVDEAGWFRTSNVIPLSSVQSIGPDAIIVPSKSAEVPASQIQQIDRVLEHNNIMKGTKIVSTDGRDLGKMIDLYFDEHSGEIEGYEVSGGLFADAYTGRSFVPAPETLKIGKDVAFVPSETANMMQEQVGGIKAAMQNAGEKIQETAQVAGDKLQAAGQTATRSVTNAIVDPQEQKTFALGKLAQHTVIAPDGTRIVLEGEQITSTTVAMAESHDRLGELYRSAGGSLTEKIGERVSNTADNLGERVSTTADSLGARIGSTAAGLAVDRAQGRRVTKAVYTPEGYIVAATGQIVTAQVIERAKAHHQEQALLESVGLSTRDALGDKASLTGDQLRSKTANAGEQLRTGAKGVWEQVKETAADLQERSAQAVEEKRIKGALGRAVTRVILDRNDSVILNIGDLITHQAVASARQSGVLDILLDSVYTETPKLTVNELRAPDVHPNQPHGEAPHAPNSNPPQPSLNDRPIADQNSGRASMVDRY
jgi:uncharacterized protein YrrD